MDEQIKDWRYFVHHESCCVWRSLCNDADIYVEEIDFEDFQKAINVSGYTQGQDVLK